MQKFKTLICFSILAFASPTLLSAEEGADISAWEICSEAYAPTRADRQLWAFHQSLLYNQLFPARLDYEVGYGLLIVGMGGSLIDQYGSDPISYSGVWTVGAGPQFLFRGESARVGPFGLNFNFSGACILHGPYLPPGGTWYDFVWKVGADLAVRADPLRWHVGVRWYHLSNAQGVGPWNPSSEGLGVAIGLEIIKRKY